jgi:hypothetical protein
MSKTGAWTPPTYLQHRLSLDTEDYRSKCEEKTKAISDPTLNSILTGSTTSPPALKHKIFDDPSKGLPNKPDTISQY